MTTETVAVPHRTGNSAPMSPRKQLQQSDQQGTDQPMQVAQLPIADPRQVPMV